MLYFELCVLSAGAGSSDSSDAASSSSDEDEDESEEEAEPVGEARARVSSGAGAAVPVGGAASAPLASGRALVKKAKFSWDDEGETGAADPAAVAAAAEVEQGLWEDGEVGAVGDAKTGKRARAAAKKKLESETGAFLFFVGHVIFDPLGQICVTLLWGCDLMFQFVSGLLAKKHDVNPLSTHVMSQLM